MQVGHEPVPGGTGSVIAAAAAAGASAGSAVTSRYPRLSAAGTLTIGAWHAGHDGASVGAATVTRSRQSGQQAWVIE
jgi:hypothetical protein